jgi:hypothetical protein
MIKQFIALFLAALLQLPCLADGLPVGSATSKVPVAAIQGLAASATTDTTNAANITSGTLPLARLSGITTTQMDAAAGITGSQMANNTVASGQLAKNTIQFISVPVNASQFTSQKTTPYTVIPGVANKIIVPFGWTCIYTRGTVSYTGGGTVVLRHSGNTGAIITGFGVSNFTGANSSFNEAFGAASHSGSPEDPTGQDVQLYNSTADFASGDGTFVFNIWYAVY